MAVRAQHQGLRLLCLASMESLGVNVGAAINPQLVWLPPWVEEQYLPVLQGRSPSGPNLHWGLAGGRGGPKGPTSPKCFGM